MCCFFKLNSKRSRLDLSCVFRQGETACFCVFAEGLLSCSSHGRLCASSTSITQRNNSSSAKLIVDHDQTTGVTCGFIAILFPLDRRRQKTCCPNIVQHLFFSVFRRGRDAHAESSGQQPQSRLPHRDLHHFGEAGDGQRLPRPHHHLGTVCLCSHHADHCGGGK